MRVFVSLRGGLDSVISGGHFNPYHSLLLCYMLMLKRMKMVFMGELFNLGRKVARLKTRVSLSETKYFLVI